VRTIFRVEDRNGEGPWQCRFTAKIVNDHAGSNPGWYSDKLLDSETTIAEAIYSRGAASSYVDWRAGFSSLSELRFWFNTEEIRALRNEGMRVVRLRVQEYNIIQARSQVAYLRDTELGRRQVSWDTVLEAK